MTDKPFSGEMGTTKQETTTVWCGGCGAWYGAQLYRSIDAEANPELVEGFRRDGYDAVNQLKCSACGWVHVARERLAIHYPTKRKIFLIVPDSLRHRAQRMRANFIEDVSKAPGVVVPLYVLEPVLVGGPAEFFRILAERETGLNEMPQSDVDESAGEAGSGTESNTSSQSEPRRHTKSLNLLAELLEQEDEDAEAFSEPSGGEEPAVDIEEVGIRDEANVHNRGVGRITRETTGVTLRALLEESEGSGAVDAPGVLDTDYELSRAPLGQQLSGMEGGGEPTVVSNIEQLTSADNVSNGLELNIGEPVDSTPDADSTQLSGADADQSELVYSAGLAVEDNLVVWRADAEVQSSPGEQKVIFQWHEHDAGDVFGLLLNNAGSGGEHSDGWIFKAFEPEDEVHEAALSLLSERFTVRLEYLREGALVGHHSVTAPLEDNVRTAIERAQVGRTSLAPEALTRDDFEPLAGVQHSFVEGQFGQLMTASETQVAAGIVSYWSQSTMTDRLVYRLGFPLVWWREIQRRVGEATVHFGLVTSGEYRSWIQSAMSIESESTFVTALLSHFTEVNLNLRPNELGPIALWENWDALLAWSDELGISVDAQVEELAAQALRNAEQYAEDDYEPSDESYDAIEVSLADAIDIKSLGAFNLQLDRFFQPELEGQVIEPAISELDDDELLHALNDPERRAGACVQLISRDPSRHAASIFDAVSLMSPMDLVVVVPSILPVSDVFVPLFRRALSSDSPAPRMAAAMLLAEVGDERAFNPLLSMMLEADDDKWELLAASIARMGERAVQPALSRAKVDQGGLARIAVLLGYAEAEAPGSLDGLDGSSDDPAVNACIGQARNVANELGRPETPPFAFRLASLLEGVAPGSVSLNASEL